MRRLLCSLVMSTVLLAGLPTMALAVNVSANCGAAGGNFRTHGTADNWQDHFHDGAGWHFYYYGRQFVVKSWGFETGLETGQVYGPNVAAGAYCIT